jgi:hypothetical protein
MRGLVPATMIVAFLAASGVAGAQAPDIMAARITAEVEPHGVPVPALLAMGVAQANVTVECLPPAVSLAPTEVRLRVAAEEGWVRATVSPSSFYVDFPPPHCLALSASHEIPAAVSFTFDAAAPAGARASLRLFAQFGEGVETEVAQWTETVGNLLRPRALLDGPAWHREGGPPYALPLVVTNQGNGPILVSFHHVEPPEVWGYRVEYPPAFELAAPQPAAEREERLIVTVHALEGQVHDLRFQVRFATATAGLTVEEATVDIAARTGSDRSVNRVPDEAHNLPAIVPLIAVLVLAGVIALRRHT